jgi:hypothetical protein
MMLVPTAPLFVLSPNTCARPVLSRQKLGTSHPTLTMPNHTQGGAEAQNRLTLDSLLQNIVAAPFEGKAHYAGGPFWHLGNYAGMELSGFTQARAGGEPGGTLAR